MGLFAATALAADAPDPETSVKLTEYMLKTPLNEADPKVVSGFMKIDAKTLPIKLRDKARGKQMEIDSVVKISKGAKKGPFRYPNACTPKRYGPEGIKIMGMIIGNAEMRIDEEDYLESRSKCTEDQLICEFSLNVVLLPRPGKTPLKRYWMMEQDPLMAWVGEYRNNSKTGGGNYFEALKPTCQKLAAETK